MNGRCYGVEKAAYIFSEGCSRAAIVNAVSQVKEKVVEDVGS